VTQRLPFGPFDSIFAPMQAPFAHMRSLHAGARPVRRPGSCGLLPGCPGAAPLHDHALLPWRFHPLLRAADGIL